MTDTSKKIVVDSVADKYRLVQTEDGKVVMYRNGEVWPAGNSMALGNSVLLAFAQRLQEANQLIARLCDHEGAEGWSHDLRRDLDAYDADERAFFPVPRK